MIFFQFHCVSHLRALRFDLYEDEEEKDDLRNRLAGIVYRLHVARGQTWPFEVE